MMPRFGWSAEFGGAPRAPRRLFRARRPAQLAPLNEVFGWTLDETAKQTINRILADTIKDPVGPEFMAPPSKKAA
jgi:hypothetical protein